jgi:hypothetical protein
MFGEILITFCSTFFFNNKDKIIYQPRLNSEHIILSENINSLNTAQTSL